MKKIIKCRICRESFTSQEEKQEHFQTAHEKIHKCEYCQKAFKLKYVLNMNRHIKMIHEKVEKSFQCDKCEKSFMCQSHLTTQMKRHTIVIKEKSKNFTCK